MRIKRKTTTYMIKSFPPNSKFRKPKDAVPMSAADTTVAVWFAFTVLYFIVGVL